MPNYDYIISRHVPKILHSQGKMGSRSNSDLDLWPSISIRVILIECLCQIWWKPLWAFLIYWVHNNAGPCDLDLLTFDHQSECLYQIWRHSHADLKISRSRKTETFFVRPTWPWNMATKIKSVNPWLQVNFCAKCAKIPRWCSRDITFTRQKMCSVRPLWPWI